MAELFYQNKMHTSMRCDCSTESGNPFCSMDEHNPCTFADTLKTEKRRNIPVFIALLAALYSGPLTSASQGFAHKGIDTFSLFGLFLLEKTPSKCSTTCGENTSQSEVLSFLQLKLTPMFPLLLSESNKC